MYHVVTHLPGVTEERPAKDDVAGSKRGSEPPPNSRPASSGAPESEARPEPKPRAKKERVLHTRIPAVLEAELKAAAGTLRMPVSNLVRTILEDAVAIADKASHRVEDGLQRAVRATSRVESGLSRVAKVTSTVEDGLDRAARSVNEEREKMQRLVKPGSSLKDVLAYQPVIIAAATECRACGGGLEAGDDAALGVTERPGPRIFVCENCIPGARAGPEGPTH